MEKCILNFTHLFISMSTSYVRTHIEDMRTKKALSAWIPWISVFCSSGAVSGIRGKQMTPAVASERSIFSKNHDYNSRVAVNTYVRTYVRTYKLFLDIDARGGRKLRTDTHTLAEQPQ